MHNSGKRKKKPVKELEEPRARKAKLEYVSREIIESKKVQEELKKSKEFLLNTINALDDPFFVKDERHRWVILNDAACEVMGRSKEELIGKSDYDLFPKDQADIFWERDNRVFESGKTDINEEKITWHGKLHTISTKKSVFTDSLTGKRFIAGTIRDITEHKHAEEELRESEEKFRNLAEQTPNMVFIYKKGKIVYANVKCEKIMGYRKEEFYSPDFNFMVLIAPESQDLVKKSFSEHMQGNEVVPFEYTLLTKEGKRIEAIYTSKLIRYEGENAILGTVTDITELKKAERALRESEERFRKIFEEGPLGMALIDKNLKMVRVNRRLCEMLGYSETELTGLPFTEVTRPSDISYDIELARQVFSGQMPTYQIEKNFVKKDKTVLWAKLTASAIHDENGQAIYGLGMIEDITEHKKAKQKLLDSEASYRELANSITDIFFAMDKDLRYTFWNKASEELTGIPAKDAIGKSLCDIFPHTHQTREAERIYLEVLESRQARSFINKYQLKGKNFYFEISVYPSQQGLSVFVKDITERKQAEEALQESEEKLRNVVERANDGIAIIQDGLLKYVNPRTAEITGYTIEEMTNTPFARYVAPDELPKLADMYQRRMAGEEITSTYETVVRHKDGSDVHIEVNAGLVTYEGKPADLTFARDITERKNAEQKLLQDQVKLKSLASQLTLAEERQRRHVATELHDRIGQSLVISKIKLDQIRKSAVSCELDETLEDVSNCIEQVIQDTRTLTFDLSSPILYERGFEAAVAEWLTEQIQEKHGIETEFEDDRQQKPLDDDIRVILFRNIRELLINVVKHAQAQKIRVSTRRVDKHIHIVIEDNGVGFDAMEVMSTAARGAKLGLFSIRERLEQLGGLFEIESEPGRGSKITMTAPLRYEKGTEGTRI